MECNDNEFCKNLDLYKSSPGKIVYRCPTSTCSAGTWRSKKKILLPIRK